MADPHRSEAINRGAYLVEGLGHCGECHNRNAVFGASDWSGRFRGGEIEGWYAPSLTAAGRDGIGTWSEDQLVAFLKTDAAPGKGVALGPMKQTIEDSLRYLSDDDLHAIAAYLKSTGEEALKPGADAPVSATPSSGSRIYLSSCAYCHRPDGQGVFGMIPSLAGNGAATSRGPENVIRVVLGGLEVSHGLAPMPAIGATLSDQEIAEVTNYIRTAWGNAAPNNAQSGTVAELRTKTHTLLAGNLPEGCPSIADPTLSKVIDRNSLAAGCSVGHVVWLFNKGFAARFDSPQALNLCEWMTTQFAQLYSPRCAVRPDNNAVNARG